MYTCGMQIEWKQACVDLWGSSCRADKSYSTNLLGTPACITPSQNGSGGQSSTSASVLLMPSFDNWDALAVFRADGEKKRQEIERNRVEEKKLSLAACTHPHSLRDAFCVCTIRKVCGGALDFQSDPLRHASNSGEKNHSHRHKALHAHALVFFLVLCVRKLFSVGQHKSTLPCFPLAADFLCELISNKIAWGVACDL